MKIQASWLGYRKAWAFFVLAPCILWHLGGCEANPLDILACLFSLRLIRGSFLGILAASSLLSVVNSDLGRASIFWPETSL